MKLLSFIFLRKFLGTIPKDFLSPLKSCIILALSFAKFSIALANGFNKWDLYQAIWASPTSPLPKVEYNKPTKSSADGGIKKLNLPLLAPATSALTLEYVLSEPIPVLFSIISLKSLLRSSDLLNLIFACWVLDLTSITLRASLTALTFWGASSAK